MSNFGAASYYGSAPSPLTDRSSAWPTHPATAPSWAATYPSGAYGYDISNYQCSSFPTGDHQIGIVEVDGALIDSR